MVDVVSADASAAAPGAASEVIGPHSPLALLRGKRQALESKLFLDLEVPRWREVLGRSLWVRYRPGNPAVFARDAERREKAHREAVGRGQPGDPDYIVRANVSMLVDACEAVYDLAIGEDPPEGELPDGEYPTFSSPELSESLDAPPKAVETVMHAYGTKADVLIAANQLLAWSGQASEKVDKDFLGNLPATEPSSQPPTL